MVRGSNAEASRIRLLFLPSLILNVEKRKGRGTRTKRAKPNVGNSLTVADILEAYGGCGELRGAVSGETVASRDHPDISTAAVIRNSGEE